MKKSNVFNALLILLLSLAILPSCTKKEEQFKMLPVSAIKLTGEHSDLIKINADSVKIMLVKLNEDDGWTVRALIPISNTSTWSDVNVEKYVEGRKAKKGMTFGYQPSMSPSVSFYDANGNEIDLKMSLYDSEDAFRNVLSSNALITDNALIKSAYESIYAEYERNKAVFDKVAEIKITNLTLDKEDYPKEPKPESFEDAYNRAAKQYEDAYNRAAKQLEDAGF